MEYSILHHAFKKIGRAGYPQSIDVELDPERKVTDEDFVWNLRHGVAPAFTPYVGTVVVRKGATLTDLISSVTNPIGFICSPRLKDLMEKFRIGTTNFYDMTVKHEGCGYSHFYLMHCVNSYTAFVDFPQCEFWRVKSENGIEVQERVEMRTSEQYRSFQLDLVLGKMEPFSRSITKSIRFKPGFVPLDDMFVLDGINGDTYVSSELRKALETSKFTGITFEKFGKPPQLELST